MPCDKISASTVKPSSAAFFSLITITAAAPSLICDDEPAVMVPLASKAGRSLPKDSDVVSVRIPSSVANMIGSPLRCGIATGTISSSNRPAACAEAAR